MKKKIALLFFIAFICIAQSFALTADKDWHARTETYKLTTKDKKGKATTKTAVRRNTNKGITALGIGLNIGYPFTGGIIRYRDGGNHLRILANVNYEYSDSLAASLNNVKYYSPNLNFEGFLEYVLFSMHVGGANDKNKLWYLDFAPTAGVGLYYPLDDPKNPVDYFGVPISLGGVLSLDLPYSKFPATVYLRGLYRLTIPFIQGNFRLVNRYSVDVGISFNFIEFGSKNKTTNTKTTTTNKTTNNKSTKNTKSNSKSTNNKNTKTNTKTKSNTKSNTKTKKK